MARLLRECEPTGSIVQVLPRNTCPLIKSSFGFKLGRLCPYLQTSHLVVGEITCDGEKKMYQLLAEHQPAYVMEVPNRRGERGRALWRGAVHDSVDVIEELTGNVITADKLAVATWSDSE